MTYFPCDDIPPYFPPCSSRMTLININILHKLINIQIIIHCNYVKYLLSNVQVHYKCHWQSDFHYFYLFLPHNIGSVPTLIESDSHSSHIMQLGFSANSIRFSRHLLHLFNLPKLSLLPFELCFDDIAKLVLC